VDTHQDRHQGGYLRKCYSGWYEEREEGEIGGREIEEGKRGGEKGGRGRGEEGKETQA
jgi:hypothetical protein